MYLMACNIVTFAQTTECYAPIRKLKGGDVVYCVNYKYETSTFYIQKYKFANILDEGVYQDGSSFFLKAGSYYNMDSGSQDITKFQCEPVPNTLISKKIDNPCENVNTNVTPDNIVLNNLQILNKNKRTNQDIEIERWEGVNGDVLKIYHLKDGVLTEVNNPLTDKQIENGEWNGGTETKIRYTYQNGRVQIKSFGFRKDIANNARLPEISAHIKEKANEFFKENNVKEYSNKPAKPFEDTNQTFADGERIVIGGGNSTFVKIISEGIGITTTLLKTGQIEENVYKTSTKSTATIHAPGVVTGSTEVVAQKVTDLTSLATLAYDLVVDKEVRSQIYNQFVEIKNEIGEDPKAFVPILFDVLVNVVTNQSVDDLKSTINSNTDTGKRTHVATSATGNVIITAVAGAAIVKDLPEIAEKLGENIKKVKNIRKVFNSATEMVEDIVKRRGLIRQNIKDLTETKNLVKEYARNIGVKDADFESWFNGTDGIAKFEAHHVIPIDVLESNPYLKDFLYNLQKNNPDFKFDFNSIDNGIMVQKKSVVLDINGHAKHNEYSLAIDKKISEICGSTSIDDIGKFEEIQDLIQRTKEILKTEVLLGTKNVNEIVNF